MYNTCLWMYLLNEIGGFKWKGAFKKNQRKPLKYLFIYYYILHLNVKQWFKLIFKDK